MKQFLRVSLLRLRSVFAVQAVISVVICSSLHAAWFKELPAPKIEMELPINLEAAKAGWDLSPDLAVVRDEILQTDTLERKAGGNGWIRSRAALPAGTYEVVARVRIADAQQQGMTLHVGANGNNNAPDSDCSVSAYALPSYSDRTIRIMAAFGTPTSQGYLSKTELLRGEAVKVRLPNSGIWFAERFKNISPVLDADLREEMEAAMSKVPLAKDTWFELRVVVGPDAIQIYRDGYLVGERQPAGRVEGAVQIQLSANIRIASLVVRRLVSQPDGFQPVRIDVQSNAKFALKENSLPAVEEVTINKIPFVFPRTPTGNNHLDVSESLFHYRNKEGHFDANETWPAPQVSDPNRIRFSVPNRPYSRLWVVAAFDGQPNRVPIVTARFYRPNAGFAIDAATNVPAFDARRSEKGAIPLPIKLADRKDANLWLLPIELDAAKIGSELRNEDFLSLEITKQVFPFRTYPDPANYGWFQGGLPSGVRIFAMTLEEAPLRFIASGNRWGNTYVTPETPVWRVSLENLRDEKIQARVRVSVTDPYCNTNVGSSRVDLQACKLEYSIVSPK